MRLNIPKRRHHRRARPRAGQPCSHGSAGPGIEAKHLPHLFDRFYRSSSERSDERRSTGLGLAITKAIIDAHRGQIIVESELGQGSCFTVRIPQA
ncbi:MAG: ATP-binding protein [Coraliomargarita sp.]